MDELIVIKPHHFMDIIKLYGSGIEVFVPDERMGHDFYRVANTVISDSNVKLKLTVEGDDICKPCKKCISECIDAINHIPGFTGKNAYNRALDQRMIKLYSLNKQTYTAEELCTIYYRNKEYIYDVWTEENIEITDRRCELFTKGAMKYLNR